MENQRAVFWRRQLQFSVTLSIRVQRQHSRVLLRALLRGQNERNASRTRSPRGKSPSGKMARWPCKDYLKGTCTNSCCEKWHPPECLFYKTKSGCRFWGKSARMHIVRLMNSRQKGLKKNDDKSAVAILKKGDWQERGPVTDQCHDRTRETWEEE